jgi:hypothetical protein
METNPFSLGKDTGARAEVMILALEVNAGVRFFQLVTFRKIHLCIADFSKPGVLIIREYALREHGEHEKE